MLAGHHQNGAGMPIDATGPSEALRKQIETDAGPHATPDQLRAAQKRREAAEGRGSAPQERHAGDLETVTRKRGKK